MLRVASKRLSSLSWRANHAASAFVSKNPIAPLSSDERRSDPFSIHPEFFLPFRGFASESLTHAKENSILPEIP
ncbi:hypothetical protein RYX36_000735, partial [Vicia faba]